MTGKEMTMSAISQSQKNQKRQSIMQAAYECFLHNGIHKTSIDEIVKRANVAKGTFYHYFKDKNDVSQQIFVSLSKKVITNAYREVRRQQLTDYLDITIAFVDSIVEFFRRNKLMLKLLERNFSWPLIESRLSQAPEDEELREIMEILLNNPYQPGRSRDEVFQILFSIIALCGSVCYSSIMQSEPTDIDHMKPVLYGMIRKILQ